jgi:uncharacterized membrane-anchored protein YhcB (DUF1043 family)
MRIIGERPAERRRVVIFTESLVTQNYLQRALIERGGFAPESITLFRGNNESARANQALERWQSEIGANLPAYQQPSRAVAVRLALVSEFRTRSQVFISTEAGAKGLNLQFCDTIVNYDLPWNPQRIEQRIGRCHRYGQQHDVTVVNFLASDNEALQLTFEILSQKLDLFGKVLDASDVVLHEPSTDAPEKLAGVLGSDFETRLRRIYDRARTIDEVTGELRRLREQMEEERKKYEETWSRTAGLIETRFDQRVRQVFRHLQTELPKGLARLDSELDRLVEGFLRAQKVRYDRTAHDGHIRYRIEGSASLPAGFETGGAVIVGRSDEAEADALHPGHPLVQAALEEARAASAKPFRVAWKLGRSAPPQLAASKGRRGRLALTRVRYEGFERVDRLIPTALLASESKDAEPIALDADCARWLLDRPPRDNPRLETITGMDAELEDAIDEMIFLDQAEVSAQEQQFFDRSIEQVERYMEDRLLVLRRRLAAESKSLEAAQDRRDAALGSDARDEAARRIGAIQKNIDELEAEISRLEQREDPGYEQWRDRVHQRRYRPPAVTRILDVDFILE